MAFRFRDVALVAGGAAMAAATVAWLLRRSAESRETSESRPPAAEGARHHLPVPLPHSARIEPEAERLPQVSARPSVGHESPSSPDDYDSLSPEDLGAAFLAGATDTALDEPPSSVAELQGFRIFEREEPADISDDESDDESGDVVTDDSLGRAR